MNARNQCELRTKRTDKLFEEKRVNMRELDLSIQQVLERRHRNGEDKLPPGETAETKKNKKSRWRPDKASDPEFREPVM